jgi:hypothetical protein
LHQDSGDLRSSIRNGEQPLYDFNTPWSMAIVVLGFLSAWFVTNLLENLCVTRHVWHLPLFFAALAVPLQEVRSQNLLAGQSLIQ